MDTLLFVVGFIGFIVSIVMLVVNIIKKKPKKKMVILLLASVIMVVVGANMGAEPSEPTSEKIEPNKVVAEPVITEPEYVKISAMDLYQEYKNNEVAADNKYKKETLEITGTVKNIGKDILDNIYITLDVGEYFDSVQCFFKDSESESVAELVKDQEITITGRCDGLAITSVAIKNSKIKE